MATQKFDIGGLLPEGSKVENVSIKAPEDPDDKAARLRREFWSFVVKELVAYAVAYLFLILIGVYCCFVVASHGVVSAEARAVFPAEDATRVDVSLRPGETATVASGPAAADVTCGRAAAIVTVAERAPLLF